LFQIISDNETLPSGYQLLVDGSKVAIKSEWLTEILHKLRKKDKACALKKIIDCFLTPHQYGIRGRTTAF